VHTEIVNGQGKTTRAERGAATRANILAAARQRFASDGYERTTIRAVASDAGIDPSLVMRYFGNKQGLFVAAAKIDLNFPDLTTVPRDEIGSILVSHFFELWDKGDVLCAMLRSATSNEDCAARMRVAAMHQVMDSISGVCEDKKTLKMRATLISSQIIGFAYCRYVLKLPALTSMRKADVVGWLAPTIQSYLFDPVDA